MTNTESTAKISGHCRIVYNLMYIFTKDKCAQFISEKDFSQLLISEKLNATNCVMNLLCQLRGSCGLKLRELQE